MRAAIYVRQSQDKSGQGAAVARQLAECTALAERNRWTVGEVYTDNDASATKGTRAAWTRLLRDLDNGKHDVLVCWHTDRLYRRLRDLVELVEIAERRALRIASVQAADLDLSTPSGRMLAGMLGHAARYEVEQKGARQVAANRARAQQGVSIWTRRPFGFDRDGHRVYVAESEAKEIRAAADALLSGYTLTEVAKDWNARGVHTSLGGQWSIRTVKAVVLNPRNAGRVVYKGEDMGEQGPQILDPETYDRLHALLTDPRRKMAPSTTVKYLLGGIARCGRDGCTLGRMDATTNGQDRVPVYRCRRCYLARQRGKVDEVVMAAITARLSRPDAISLLNPAADVEGLQARAVEARGRRDGLAALLADGLLAADAVREQACKLTDQIAQLEREIDATTGHSPLADVLGHADVKERLESLPILKLRDVIRTLCDVVILPAGKGVRFAPEQVRIDWKG